MAIETVSDAIDASKILYTGRDPHLLVKLDWWAAQLGPSKRLQDVTTDDIDLGIQVLLETPKKRYSARSKSVVEGHKSRSNGTVNKYIGALATMYKLLRLHRRLPRNFTSPLVKGLKLPDSAGRTLQVTIEDVHRLIAAARLSNNHKLPAMIAVACTTGLRKGSLQGLTWAHVDLPGRTIDVARTKNGAPTRSVLPQWAAAELARLHTPLSRKSDLIFGASDFRKSWMATLDRAGLPLDWTFHHCRHIAASVLAQSGASLVVVMQALNHKSPSMAIRYSHLNTKSLEAAVNNAWG